jgi:hypothetical protein
MSEIMNDPFESIESMVARGLSRREAIKIYWDNKKRRMEAGAPANGKTVPTYANGANVEVNFLF